MSRAASIPIRANTSWLSFTILIFSALLGVLASYTWAFAVGIGLVTALFLAWAGPTWLLGAMVLPLGLSFGFLADHVSGISGIESVDAGRLVVALMGFALLAIRQPRMVAAVREVPLYVCFLLFGAASLSWSPDIGDGLRLLCKLVYPLAVYLVASRVLQEEHGEAALLRMVRWASVLAFLLNLFVSVLGLSPYTGVGYEARFGGASHPNTVGLFSASSALVLYAAWNAQRVRANLVVAGLMFAQLIASGSRTALLAGCAGFALFEVLQRRLRRVASLAVVAVLIWVLVPTFGARTSEIGPSGTGELGGGPGVNLSGRVTLWMDVWSALMGDSQMLGRGLGTTESFFTSRYASLRSVHSGYLLLIIDAGIVGTVLALGALGWVAIHLAPPGWQTEPRLVYAPLALASLCMFLVASFTEGTFAGYAYPALLWLTFALAHASDRYHLREHVARG